MNLNVTPCDLVLILGVSGLVTRQGFSIFFFSQARPLAAQQSPVALEFLAGVVTVYETRRSLWTLSRQAPLVVLAPAMMMMVMRVCRQHAAMSVPLSLLPGMGAWLAIIVPFTIVRFRREGRMERESTRPSRSRTPAEDGQRQRRVP